MRRNEKKKDEFLFVNTFTATGDEFLSQSTET